MREIYTLKNVLESFSSSTQKGKVLESSSRHTSLLISLLKEPLLLFSLSLLVKTNSTSPSKLSQVVVIRRRRDGALALVSYLAKFWVSKATYKASCVKLLGNGEAHEIATRL